MTPHTTVNFKGVELWVCWTCQHETDPSPC